MHRFAHRPCAFCAGNTGEILLIREMMFGSRQRYEYYLCSSCRACELRSPVSLADQYPREYHAYQVQSRPIGLRGLLRTVRSRGVFGRNLAGRLLNVVAPYPVHGAARWFRRIGVTRDWVILDVGCGSGELLRDLREVGFDHAEGIDPYLPETSLLHAGAFIRKARLDGTSGPYDLVMLHHVLEHIPEQLETLRHVVRVLRPGGHCLIRIPILPNAAWERYREHWVQFDAPRHVVIHSVSSLSLVAQKAGLTVEHVEYDSTEFQFTGSELYARDMPLTELPASFGRRELRRYRKLAARLNAMGRGDQAAFYLRRR